MQIDKEEGLAIVSGNNKWGNPIVLNETQDEIKKKITSGQYRIVQLCKYIKRKEDETNESQ